MYRGLIFDLDGTLLDTIEDISDSMNQVLERNGKTPYSYEKYKQLIGHGFTNLVLDTFGREILPDEHSRLLKELNQAYKKNYMLKTRPYPGIEKLLTELQNRGIKLGVNTNKNQEYASNLIEKNFPDISFIDIIGKRDDIPLKPDRKAAHLILDKMDLEESEAIYIGDSNVDIETGKNANMATIGVDWGFRGEKELRASGADFIAYEAEDILRFIL